MIEVIHIDMAKSTIFYGRIMSCGWFWWWCMDADLMSAQFFIFFVSFLVSFFLVCVHNRFERVISRDDHFLGENITFKALFSPYCKRKTKTLFLLFFLLLMPANILDFFILNIKSLTALAVQNGHHWCIFSLCFHIESFLLYDLHCFGI